MLGKGLESLIPQKREKDEKRAAEAHAQEPKSAGASSEKRGKYEDAAEKRARFEQAVFHIEVDRIKPNPNQPRRHFNEDHLKELATSIREFGVLQPLVVTKMEREFEEGTRVEYELIAGERRLRASKLAGLATVPVIIHRRLPPKEKLELAIIENIQRQDLDPIETARAFAQLQDEFNFTQREIAARLGKSREVVANTLRLLNLPSEIQDAISGGKVNESQARLLLSITDISAQQAMYKEITERAMSVRELRERIGKKERQKGGRVRAADRPLHPEELALKERLEEILGTKVDIMRSGGQGGRITINFFSPEELRAIIEKFFSQS